MKWWRFGRWVDFIGFLSAFGAYFVLAKLGLFLATFHHNSSPVWPASGLAIAALALGGRRYAPAIFLGAFFANLTTETPWLISLGIATGNAMEAVVGGWIVDWGLRRQRFLDEQREVFAFGGAAVIGPVIAATGGAFCLWLGGLLPAEMFAGAWLTWWVGDALGILVVAPIFFVFNGGFRQLTRTLGETLFVSVLSVFLCLAIFFRRDDPLLLFLLFPLLLWVATRLSALEAKVLALFMSIVSVWGTFRGLGPFHLGTLNQNLLCLQLFMATIAVTALVLRGLRRAGSLRLPAFALFCGWFLTAAIFNSFQNAETERDRQRMEKLIERKTAAITERMVLYSDALRSGASLFAASKEVTKADWRNYVEHFQVGSRYPGIYGMGVITKISVRAQAEFEKKMRRQQGEKFHIRSLSPDESKSDRFVITYLEPEEANTAAMGLDVGSELHRRVAAERARDNGEPSMTSRITLVQDRGDRPGFLVFMPFYRGRPTSVEERRRQLIGWVYAPFITEKFFRGILGDDASEVELLAFDGEKQTRENLVFSSGEAKFDSPFEVITPLTLAGNPMRLAWRRSAGFVSSHDTTTAWVTACGGLMTLLLAVLLAGLQSINRKAEGIAREKTRQLTENESRIRQLNQELERRVSERTVQLEQALFSLRRSEADFRQLADSMPQIVWTAKPSGEIDYFNERWYEFTGLSRDWRPGDAASDLLTPEDSEGIEKKWRYAVENGTPFEMQYRFLHRSTGEYRWQLARALPVRDTSGKIVKWFGTTTDIHEQKKMEIEQHAAREASRMKSDFLARMSHEIRTPINGVLGMAGLLADTSLDPLQHEYVDSILHSGEDLLLVINDILDFSKVEAGKLDFDEIDFDVFEAFEQTERVFHFQARRKGLTLSLEMDPALPRALKGDPGRLRQVLNNLISNAIKFTAKGAIRISAKALPADSGFGALRCEVKDSGIGIPESAMNRMFKAFSQADSSTARRFGGTGLGLSICKHLVERMQGRIGVDSVEGSGSTFWFEVCLPLGTVSHETQQGKPVPNFSLKGLRVLVAEDTPVNQKIIVKMLEKLEIRADVAGNGYEALEALRSAPYDLILMDCQMPEMDGYEASRIIRSSHTIPQGTIPIIAVTAHAIKGDEQKCFEAGMNDYLTKPVRFDELFRTLVKWSGREATVPMPDAGNSEARPSEVLDMSAIASLDELGGEEMVQSTVDLYLENLPGHLEVLQAMLRNGEWSSLCREAHSLKSSSRILGASKLAELCAHLEGLARQETTGPLLDEAVHAVISAAGFAAEALEDLRRKMKSKAS